MGYTDKDETTIIRQQKQDIETLNQKLNQVYAEQGAVERAMAHVRLAMDEAIAMATRFASLPVTDGDKVGAKRRSEANRLAAYFRECKQNFEETLKGSIVNVATKDFGVDAGEGEIAGSSEQERQGNSGSSATGVDNLRGEEK